MAPNLLANDTRLLALARRARLRWPKKLDKLYPVLALLAALFIIFIGTGLLLLMANLLVDRTGINLDFLLHSDNPNVAEAVNLVIGFLPIYVLVWLWLWLMERRPFWTIGIERAGMGSKYLRGLAVGFLMFSASIAILAFTGSMKLNAIDFTGAAITGVLVVFLGWMVQGAAEEVLTRGFLLPVISVRWGVLAGVILSSSLFALLHLFNPSLSLLAMLNLFLFGVFASLYALAEESLWGVFAIHSVWNWTQGNIYGLEVSGQQMSTSKIMQWSATGPEWLTGGSFGPEGGAAVSAVLVASSLLVVYAHRRRRRSAQTNAHHT
jgi:membrane protease YdiL (CAAX protease family)